MDDQPLINAVELKRYYTTGGSVVNALDNVTLQVDEGDMIAIMGPSGAGKTTLLNIIGGLDSPDSGKVLINGVEISSLNEGQRAKFRKSNVGFIFQFFNLIPSLTALENVLVPVMFDRNPPYERGTELLERMGLGKRMDHVPGELSGGERQRVAIARALINDPMIILADEPTGNIDSETAKSIVSLFRELNEEGKTLLLATHDRLVAGRARNMIKMRDGHITREKSHSRTGMIHLASDGAKRKKRVVK